MFDLKTCLREYLVLSIKRIFKFILSLSFARPDLPVRHNFRCKIRNEKISHTSFESSELLEIIAWSTLYSSLGSSHSRSFMARAATRDSDNNAHDDHNDEDNGDENAMLLPVIHIYLQKIINLANYFWLWYKN